MRGMLLSTHSILPGGGTRGSRRCSTIAAAAAATGDLRGWVKSQGGFVWSGLHLLQTGLQGMELVAVHDLPRGSTIVTLPRKAPLPMPDPNDANLSSSERLICELAQGVPEELWAVRLGLKLLSERAKQGSYWWPYISLLPQSFTLPMFFSGSDINNIDYVPVTHQVKMRGKFLRQMSSELAALNNLPSDKHPFGGQTVDTGSLGWAMAAVSSRAFKVRGVNNKLCSAMMLPLIDMCNHSFQPNASILEDLSKDAQDVSFLKLVTKEDLKRGAPITIDYGPLSNDILLLDYGFVIPDNPHDRIELRYDVGLLENARIIAGLSKDDSKPFSCPTPRQSELLKQLELLKPGELQKVTLGGPEHVDGRLLAALRILYAEENHLEALKDPSLLQSWEATGSLINDENERKVIKTLCALSAIVLKQFKTTSDQDERMLEEVTLRTSTKLAIQFRLTKKKVILQVLDFLKTRLMELQILKA